MTADVCTANSEDTVQNCMNMMTDRRWRHLPGVDNGAINGMISIGDLVKAIIADQKEEIEHLEHYIST
jgi:predicted transcriptional regulator